MDVEMILLDVSEEGSREFFKDAAVGGAAATGRGASVLKFSIASLI